MNAISVSQRCAYAVYETLDDHEPVYQGECFLFDLPRRVYTLSPSQYLKVIHLFEKRRIEKMNFNIYAIFDRKAKTYSDVFLSPNHGTAMRDFSYLVENVSAKQFIKKDLELYCLGTFNSVDGVVKGLDVPEFISEVINENE